MCCEKNFAKQKFWKKWLLLNVLSTSSFNGENKKQIKIRNNLPESYIIKNSYIPKTIVFISSLLCTISVNCFLFLFIFF
jgi:hypothetical protein